MDNEVTITHLSTLDPFEGDMNRPMSLNGYSWVEGNVANRVDPSGRQVACPAKDISNPATFAQCKILFEKIRAGDIPTWLDVYSCYPCILDISLVPDKLLYEKALNQAFEDMTWWFDPWLQQESGDPIKDIKDKIDTAKSRYEPVVRSEVDSNYSVCDIDPFMDWFRCAFVEPEWSQNIRNNPTDAFLTIGYSLLAVPVLATTAGSGLLFLAGVGAVAGSGAIGDILEGQPVNLSDTPFSSFVSGGLFTAVGGFAKDAFNLTNREYVEFLLLLTASKARFEFGVNQVTENDKWDAQKYAIEMLIAPIVSIVVPAAVPGAFISEIGQTFVNKLLDRC